VRSGNRGVGVDFMTPMSQIVGSAGGRCA